MKRTLGSIILASSLALGVGAYGVTSLTKIANANAAPVTTMSQQATTTTQDTTNSPLPPPVRSGRPGAFGKVTAVNGTTLTIEDPRQQSATTVTLTTSTTISKEATLALGDVAVGETINAFGVQASDVFTATQVRVGQGGEFGGHGHGGPPPADAAQGQSSQSAGQQAQGPQGAGPQGQGPQGVSPQGMGPWGKGSRPDHAGGTRLVGTVEQVTSTTLTVKTTAGATVTLKLATSGRVVKQVAGTSADITVGSYIMARGTQNASAITATNIMLLPAPPQQP